MTLNAIKGSNVPDIFAPSPCKKGPLPSFLLFLTHTHSARNLFQKKPPIPLLHSCTSAQANSANSLNSSTQPHTMSFPTTSSASRSISSITTARTASLSPRIALNRLVDSGYESEDEDKILAEGLALRMRDSVDVRREQMSLQPRKARKARKSVKAWFSGVFLFLH
jgi:hypothetical protein